MIGRITAHYGVVRAIRVVGACASKEGLAHILCLSRLVEILRYLAKYRSMRCASAF